MPAPFDVRSFLTAWNTHQPERILEFYSDDAEIHVPPDPEPYRGKEGVRQNVRDVMEGMGDLNGDLRWSAQEQNRVAMLVQISGRHTGPLHVSESRIIPPTDRRVDFQAALFLELDARGKVKREVDIVDNLSLLEQVGAMETGAQRGRPASRPAS